MSTFVGCLMPNLFLYKGTILFQVIQFSISTQFSSIWLDRTLSEATTPGHSGPGCDDNEGVLYIPQSSSITGTSPSDCLVSYHRHLLEGSGVLPLCRDAVSVFYSPADRAKLTDWLILMACQTVYGYWCQKTNIYYYSFNPHTSETHSWHKLATAVVGEPKVPFSIATTPWCREGATPFPGFLHLPLIHTL